MRKPSRRYSLLVDVLVFALTIGFMVAAFALVLDQ